MGDWPRCLKKRKREIINLRKPYANHHLGDQHRGHKNRWWTKPEQGKGTRKEKGKESTQIYISKCTYIYKIIQII